MNKKWMYALAVLAAVFVGFFMYHKYRVAPAVQFNQLQLTDLGGNPYSISSLKGKKTVVCFSASWCPNCLEEMADIYSVKQDLADVEIIVISDEPLEKVQAFKDKHNYPFTFLKMNQAFNEIGIHSIPTSYVLNTQQEVKKETVGYIDWKNASNREHLKKLMD